MADIECSFEQGIGRIILNRPNVRNALNQAMWRDLPKICQDLSTARVVVISGAGGAFSAGADIAEFDKVYADQASIEAANVAVRRAQQALADLPCPVIAAIDGACVGGGCGLALHADLRFATERSRFGITPAKLGISYSYEDTARLVQTVGPAAAKDILFSSRIIDAAQAHRIGLVDRVGPVADHTRMVEDYISQLVALSPESLAIAKAMIAAVVNGGGPDQNLVDRFAASFTGPDFLEGVSAFRQKRTPVFR